MKSSQGEPVRLVIYTSHHLHIFAGRLTLTVRALMNVVQIYHNLTTVSKGLGICSLTETGERYQSARFSRPAKKERVLQELSVPSAVTSFRR